VLVIRRAGRGDEAVTHVPALDMHHYEERRANDACVLAQAQHARHRQPARRQGLHHSVFALYRICALR
jgi:hypothetical protein